MPELARVLLMTPHLSFEARGEPLAGIEVAPLGSAGVMLGFAMPRTGGKALLGVKDRDAFWDFAIVARDEATTPAKRFFKGEFALQVELPYGPAGTLTVGPIRGKRMVSFVRDGTRILHAWCEGGVLHTLWAPADLRDALAEVALGIMALQQSGADAAPAPALEDEA